MPKVEIVKFLIGDVFASIGDAFTPIGDIFASIGDVFTSIGDIFASIGDIFIVARWAQKSPMIPTFYCSPKASASNFSLLLRNGTSLLSK
jgi:hypothetical protein